MTCKVPAEISGHVEALSEGELLIQMRQHDLEITHTLFATISNDYTAEEMDKIAADLQAADVLRWKRELTVHLATKSAGTGK